MAAPEADSEQTRVLIDAGEQRMVLMVDELFARAATNFEGEAQNGRSLSDESKPQEMAARGSASGDRILPRRSY